MFDAQDHGLQIHGHMWLAVPPGSRVGWGVVTPELLDECANGFFENLISNQTKWFHVYHL